MHPAAVFRSDGSHLFLFLMFAIKSRGTLISKCLLPSLQTRKGQQINQNTVGQLCSVQRALRNCLLVALLSISVDLKDDDISLLLLKLEMVWLLEV